MLRWYLDLGIVFAPLQIAWFLWWTLHFQRELKSSLIVDWGPQGNRILNWCVAILIACPAVMLLTVRSGISDVVLALIYAMLAVNVAIRALPHLGIYKEGAMVTTNVFWGTHSQFIPWSEMKAYRWQDEDRRLINPGWGPTVSKFTPEMVNDLKAALKEKCPDAALEIHNVAP